jgi:hypothetical protein
LETFQPLLPLLPLFLSSTFAHQLPPSFPVTLFSLLPCLLLIQLIARAQPRDMVPRHGLQMLLSHYFSHIQAQNASVLHKSAHPMKKERMSAILETEEGKGGALFPSYFPFFFLFFQRTAVPAALPTPEVTLNEIPAAQYDLIADLLDADIFKVYSDMLWSDSLRIQKHKSGNFGYLTMTTVTTVGSLNVESFYESVLSCVKLVVSDLHVSLKTEQIHMFVILRMNHEFMEYRVGGMMRVSYPDTPLSEFKV